MHVILNGEPLGSGLFTVPGIASGSYNGGCKMDVVHRMNEGVYSVGAEAIEGWG